MNADSCFIFRYYSVCFLNQLSLSHAEKELAGQLIKIYFAFFKVSFILAFYQYINRL